MTSLRFVIRLLAILAFLTAAWGIARADELRPPHRGVRLYDLRTLRLDTRTAVDFDALRARLQSRLLNPSVVVGQSHCAWSQSFGLGYLARDGVSLGLHVGLDSTDHSRASPMRVLTTSVLTLRSEALTALLGMHDVRW